MNVFITIGGQGTRLKKISSKDKHLLYFKNTRIIDWIQKILPNSIIIGTNKTQSRYHTLLEISELNDCLIVDCDIIPFGLNLEFESDENTLFVFNSKKNKYGSVLIEDDRVVEVSEKKNISDIKCSGVYFVKSMKSVLENMKDENSICSGMIGSKVIFENSFLRLGDVEDYMDTIKNNTSQDDNIG